MLNDLNPRIAAIWNWLIHEATERDVMSWPALGVGESLRDVVGLCDAERDLLGFAINQGVSAPRHTVTSRGRWGIPRLQSHVLRYLPLVRHWQITCQSYGDLANETATWFIDPPYSDGGEHYPEHKIDYEHLAGWCRERDGHVIVCENEGGTWLPFTPLIQQRGSRKNQREVMWVQ